MLTIIALMILSVLSIAIAAVLFLSAHGVSRQKRVDDATKPRRCVVFEELESRIS